MASAPALDRREAARLEHGHELPPALFILATQRSFSSVVCAMVGQHPQLYGLPEINLLCHETVAARAERTARQPHVSITHGLLRVVAELYFGGQTEATVARARQWLRDRSDDSTQLLFRTLADRVFPRALVEKSPSMVQSPQCLRRIGAKFPDARFLHLVRHPRGHGESVMKALEQERRATGRLPPTHWLIRIAAYRPQGMAASAAPGGELDPQHWWYARNQAIVDFLQTVAPERRLRVRGEDLLGDVDAQLRRIAEWAGLRSDASAIECMKHPERSPYAFKGPRGARFGNDHLFLEDPALHPERAAAAHALEGPLRWRADGRGFEPEVAALARELGYT
jgi:hypothetical protein